MSFASIIKKSHLGKAHTSLSPNGGLERSLCKAVKVKPGLSRRAQDLGGATTVETC